MLFKRTRITTITPLPPPITRESVIEILHNHVAMIDLNPLVVERHPITPPDSANGDELLWKWYRIHDGLQSGYVKYDAGFHDLEDGLETQAYAPLGVQSKNRWTIGVETLPRDEDQVAEGAPEETGLCVKEEVELRSFILMTWYVKRTLKKAHTEMGRRLVARAERSAETHSQGPNSSGDETQQHEQNSSRGRRQHSSDSSGETQQLEGHSSNPLSLAIVDRSE